MKAKNTGRKEERTKGKNEGTKDKAKGRNGVANCEGESSEER